MQIDVWLASEAASLSIFTGSVCFCSQNGIGYGSVSPVELEGCQIACNSVPTCDSFSYNPTEKACFLKQGPSADNCNVSVLGKEASGRCVPWPACGAFPVLVSEPARLQFLPTPGYTHRHTVLRTVMLAHPEAQPEIWIACAAPPALNSHFDVMHTLQPWPVGTHQPVVHQPAWYLRQNACDAGRAGRYLLPMCHMCHMCQAQPVKCTSLSTDGRSTTISVDCGVWQTYRKQGAVAANVASAPAGAQECSQTDGGRPRAWPQHQQARRNVARQMGAE
jgi:PAN domain